MCIQCQRQDQRATPTCHCHRHSRAISHTTQQGAAAYLVLKSRFLFSIETPANTLVCTASPCQSASEIAPPGRDIHLVTPLQSKAAGLFLPNDTCFSEAEMPHNPCSWSGSEKALHVAMVHSRSIAEGYLPCAHVYPCNIRLSGSRH